MTILFLYYYITFNGNLTSHAIEGQFLDLIFQKIQSIILWQLWFINQINWLMNYHSFWSLQSSNDPPKFVCTSLWQEHVCTLDQKLISIFPSLPLISCFIHRTTLHMKVVMFSTFILLQKNTWTIVLVFFSLVTSFEGETRFLHRSSELCSGENIHTIQVCLWVLLRP